MNREMDGYDKITLALILFIAITVSAVFVMMFDDNRTQKQIRLTEKCHAMGGRAFMDDSDETIECYRVSYLNKTPTLLFTESYRE